MTTTAMKMKNMKTKNTHMMMMIVLVVYALPGVKSAVSSIKLRCVLGSVIILIGVHVTEINNDVGRKYAVITFFAAAYSS